MKTKEVITTDCVAVWKEEDYRFIKVLFLMLCQQKFIQTNNSFVGHAGIVVGWVIQRLGVLMDPTKYIAQRFGDIHFPPILIACCITPAAPASAPDTSCPVPWSCRCAGLSFVRLQPTQPK